MVWIDANLPVHELLVNELHDLERQALVDRCTRVLNAHVRRPHDRARRTPLAPSTSTRVRKSQAIGRHDRARRKPT